MTAIEAAKAFERTRRDPARGVHIQVEGDEFWATARFKDNTKSGDDIWFVFSQGQMMVEGRDRKLHAFSTYD